MMPYIKNPRFNPTLQHPARSCNHNTRINIYIGRGAKCSTCGAAVDDWKNLKAWWIGSHLELPGDRLQQLKTKLSQRGSTE